MSHKGEMAIECSEIKWQELKDFFEEVVRDEPQGQKAGGLWLPDIALIEFHIRPEGGCSQCRGIYLDLARKTGLLEGTIFSSESNPDKK